MFFSVCPFVCFASFSPSGAKYSQDFKAYNNVIECCVVRRNIGYVSGVQ